MKHTKSDAIFNKSQKLMPGGVNSPVRAFNSVEGDPIAIKSGYGSVITDVDGNIFLDFAGGIGSMNSGHGHPKILEKVKNQLEHYLHVCFTVSPYEPYILLAEELNRITPGNFKKKTLLVNSGAEAVENAIVPLS